ncbi:uncharacterized protein [Ptychodera flava]|uniref:uncharacterized protein n=1 Tax=Ptychodera flava TaxID=63121 RepID=UPI00396A2D4B
MTPCMRPVVIRLALTLNFCFIFLAGTVSLNITLENAHLKDELWILDFQPYNFDEANPPVVSTNGGQLVSGNTGNCSSVFSDAVFDENNGFYKDDYLPSAPGTKQLFTAYSHGDGGFMSNDYGVSVREDSIQFEGPLNVFLECVNSKGENIWDRSVNTESIQYNTTLYMTNVRPKQTTDGESGISFIQSHVILYWRLLRTAIVRFIITSTERLKPIFEYAIVRPMYVDDDETKGPERNKAEVELAFKTVADSDQIMAVYKDGSLNYIPIDTDNSLDYTKYDPSEVAVYYHPTDSTAQVLIDGVSVPVCPAAAGGETNIANIMCAEFGLTVASSSLDPAETSSNAVVGIVCTGSEANFGECTYEIGTDADCSEGSLSVVCVDTAVANLPKSCHDYLQQAKRAGITLEDGIYDINRDNTRMSVYCDMTRDGGGWTLVLTTQGQDGFTAGNLLNLNADSPSTSTDYSILGFVDDIKSTTDGPNFRYRIEAGQHGENGAIWEAPSTHGFVTAQPDQPTTLIEKFGDWEDDLPNNGGPQNVMPYIGTGDNLLTTRVGEVGDFGTAVCSCTGTDYNPAPWIDVDVADQPQILWYWLKEDRSEPSENTFQMNSYEDPMLAPPCDFTEYPGKCTQSWTYTVVLDVDDTGIDSRMPIDATGEFEISYFTYQCPNLKENRTDDCEYVDVPLAVIGTRITLQTTAQFIDETADKPIVKLKKLYGSDPAVDLRDGARGVQHLEQVTVDTHFFPEFVREKMETRLTLFMVCIGDEYRDLPNGCLNASVEDRYVAYTDPGFYYESTFLVDPDDPTRGFIKYYADDIEAASQSLDSHEYIHSEETHRSKFTNRALSGEERLYTLTNVFKLVPRSEVTAIATTAAPSIPTTPAPQANMTTNIIVVTTLAPGRRKREVETLDLAKRDLEEAIAQPQTTGDVFLFAGCPENSIHDPVNRHCACVKPNEEYSADTFRCEPINGDVLPGDRKINSSGNWLAVGIISLCRNLLLSLLFCIVL